MSCYSCKRNPYDSLQTTWTKEGNLIQNDYSPPNGWPYDPKNTWPIGVVEGYNSASNYSLSSLAWRRIDNITPDNTDYMNLLSTAGITEKYTPGSRFVTGFSTLKDTWKMPKPYSS